jgi:hypothetical protein
LCGKDAVVADVAFVQKERVAAVIPTSTVAITLSEESRRSQTPTPDVATYISYSIKYLHDGSS